MSTSTEPAAASSDPASTNAALPYGARAPPLDPAVTHRVTPTDIAHRLAGPVVAGFQRGSKQLGYPTANLDPPAFQPALSPLPRGVYAGFVQINRSNDNRSSVHSTVLSLGTNPTFDTKEETLEAYVMGWTGGDFYGAEMRLVVCAYVRPQYTMDGLDELTAWIRADVEATEQALQREPYLKYKADAWFDYTTKPSKAALFVIDGALPPARNGCSLLC